MASHVPFSSGFMLTSILGFFISVFFVMKISVSWGFTFALVFVIFFVSSVVSMSQIEAEDREAMDKLAIHQAGHYKKKK